MFCFHFRHVQFSVLWWQVITAVTKDVVNVITLISQDPAYKSPIVCTNFLVYFEFTVHIVMSSSAHQYLQY